MRLTVLTHVTHLTKLVLKKKIPFVTGAAVGVTGQTFTIIPSESACYHCLFPALDEDSMPTCSIEGVHPSILSIIGGIEVSEAVKIITEKKPSLQDRVLHVDLENLILHINEISDDENFENEDVKYVEKEFNNIVMDEGYKTLFNFLKLKEFVKLITDDTN